MTWSEGALVFLATLGIVFAVIAASGGAFFVTCSVVFWGGTALTNGMDSMGGFLIGPQAD